MKYRNLKLSFSIDGVTFNVISISLERFTVPIPNHSHSKNSYELHYVSYGYGTLIADGERFDIVPGTFFMTGPGVFHEQVSLPEDPMTEYGVYLQVAAPAVPAHGGESPIREFLDRRFWIGHADSGLHALMKQIVAEAELRSGDFEFMLDALMQQLVLAIVRLYRHRDLLTSKSGDEGHFSMPADQTYLTIEEAFLYNYRDLTLEQLASQVNLGTRQTERLLRKHYNKTFQQKKTEARMSAACLLLQDPARNIASVASELGYTSPEHFTNAFKSFHGITPSAYRRNLKR